MEKYVYQMFILGTGNLDKSLEKGLGGVILFSDDIKSESQLKKMISEIKNKALIPPFVSVDQEGGRVERTESIRPRRISARFAYRNGEHFMAKQAEEISRELKEWGFNLNFAPCVDVNTNPENPVIGERAFSDNPDDVIKGMDIFIKNSRKCGIIPCIKHYPGHGDAAADSHLTLPVIDLNMENMEAVHIKPFAHAVKNGVEMIMAAHLHCTCFDAEPVPSSLSRNAIGYLRNNLNYDGVVISDDMFMKGVQKYGSLEAVIAGVKAGLDMFIFRKSDDDTLNMIDDFVNIVENDEELKKRVIKSYERITCLKNKYGL